MKPALVLAGGGSRGSYHIGVWAALREVGWQPAIVTGASAGALSGAAVVSGKFEEARATLTSVTGRDVAVYPDTFRDFSSLRAFLTDVAVHGGMDVSPLERMLDRLLDEDLLRRSPVNFGIVTVLKDGLRPVEVTLGEIPRGQLRDYLLASAALYPVYRARKIGARDHIDGGYYDNLPIGLAEDMGADEVIAVDLKSVGIVRKYAGMLPVRYIRSYWNLGSARRFIPAVEQRNYRLGYLDGMKAFRRFEGKAYAFHPGGMAEFLTEYPSAVPRCFARVGAVDSAVLGATLALQKHADIHRSRKNALLAFAETAGIMLRISPEQSYTFSAFNAALRQALARTEVIEPDPRRLAINRANTVRSMADALLKNAVTPLLSLTAAALPGEFVAACYAAELMGSGGI